MAENWPAFAAAYATASVPGRFAAYPGYESRWAILATTQTAVYLHLVIN